ncbi:DUF4198 domain-containing protein [Flavisphingomonas formosensis]|uniref:DUF4198 domain-containing protein n=1 Tax=Flavisphingomonas formosensis TaxID=861534 RepID=UPI0012F9FF5B|nr:DUF4198 domain-containing protein [Sphingomonas formosensis]
MQRWARPLLLAALLAPTAALADHSFILPSNTNVSGTNTMVTFDAAGSEHVFFFDHRPIQLAAIRIWKPDGTPGESVNGVQGRFRSVFDVKLDQPGTWKVAAEQKMITGSFKLNGEERRVGGRGGAPRAGQPGPGGPGQPGEARPASGQRGSEGGEPRGPGGARGPGEGGARRMPPVAFEDIPAEATDVHLTEIANRVETFVTLGAPTTTIFKPTGKGMELEPVTHPNAIAAGETARFRFLIDGKPAAGLKVTVVPGGDRYREDVGTIELATGADGVVAVTWPHAGMYWLGAEATDDNPSEKRAEARRMSYAATFEVMTP